MYPKQVVVMMMLTIRKKQMMIMKDSTGIVNKVFRLIFRRSKMNSARREASNHSRLLSTVNHALENLILELS